MTDRELIQKAAKAAGYKALEWHREPPRGGGSSVDVLYVGQCEAHRPFRPLEDDGDALRLAVKLQIDLVHFAGHLRADVAGMSDVHQMHEGDPCAATRRAIVRAAAAIADAAGAA